MTKMIKLSLAAAVAVSALSTTASAGSLEDAIKGVTISGKIAAEYEAHSTKDDGEKSSTNVKEYDFDLTANIPVNDMITAQIGVQADHDPVVRDDNTDTADGKTDIAVTKLNFTAKTSVATVIVGKQKQPTPFLDDERGDGVVALIPAGPVTVAAGHFTGMNGGASLAGTAGPDVTSYTLGSTDGLATTYTTVTTPDSDLSLNLAQRDISALAIIAAAGPVNINAWYLMASGSDEGTAAIEDGLDGYSVNLAAKVGPVSLELNHASLAIDGTNGYKFDDETLTRLTAAMSIDAINLTAGYAMTNDAEHDFDGTDVNGRLHGVDLTSDNDAKTNFAMELANLDAFNDADAFLLGASTTFGKTTLSATYLDGDAKTDTTDSDFNELDLVVSYAMSKNFTLTGKYAMLELKEKTAAASTKYEDDAAIINLTYKF